MYKRQIQALKDFDKAIDMDRYDPDGWAARAIVRLQDGDVILVNPYQTLVQILGKVKMCIRDRSCTF